jgi:hypothetical protein
MRRLVLVSALASALGAASIAVAATLGVSSAKLTTYSAATSAPSSSCTLNAAEDSYANAQSTGTNYGTAVDLLVENGSKSKRSFVRFDVASCVPANGLVLTAQLSLYLVDAPNVNRTWELYRVTGAWTEAGLTWNNQPGVAGAATASIATGTTNGVWTTWDVLVDLQAFADGTANQGWRVWDQNDTQNPGRGGGFSSREAASNTPSLAITYYP